jgi:hypothetical protein
LAKVSKVPIWREGPGEKSKQGTEQKCTLGRQAAGWKGHQGVSAKVCLHWRHLVALTHATAKELGLRPIYTRVRFRIRLVFFFFLTAEKFCSYDWANLMQNWPLKSDV